MPPSEGAIFFCVFIKKKSCQLSCSPWWPSPLRRRVPKVQQNPKSSLQPAMTQQDPCTLASGSPCLTNPENRSDTSISSTPGGGAVDTTTVDATVTTAGAGIVMVQQPASLTNFLTTALGAMVAPFPFGISSNCAPPASQRTANLVARREEAQERARNRM